MAFPRPHIDRFVLPDGLLDRDVEIHHTASGVPFVRTPDERFADLEGYPFAPHYVEIDGLRVHYVDEGPADGPLVLLVHGQPTWSYLYRHMIPRLAAAGRRVVAWDNIGFGRSDKPTDPAIHTYDRHIGWYHQLIEALELEDINLFCQDWGGVIGLRVVADDPGRFASVVAANTGLPENSSYLTGDDPFLHLPAEAVMGTDPRRFIDAALADNPAALGFRGNFQWWIDYCLTSADFRPGDFVLAMTNGGISEAVMAGYDAPFPSYLYAIAPHVFPAMVPTITDDNIEAWNALGSFTRPFLYLGGDFDNIGSPEVQRQHVEHIPGAAGQAHGRFPAGHFIQEQLGAEMAGRALAFFEVNGV